MTLHIKNMFWCIFPRFLFFAFFGVAAIESAANAASPEGFAIRKAELHRGLKV